MAPRTHACARAHMYMHHVLALRRCPETPDTRLRHYQRSMCLPHTESAALAGALEFVMTSAHTASGRLAHSKRTLAFSVLLELPVLAFTICVLLLLEQRTVSAVLPHALSLAQTAAGVGVNVIWLACVEPRCAPRAGLTVALATVAHSASKRVPSSQWLLGGADDAQPAVSAEAMPDGSGGGALAQLGGGDQHTKIALEPSPAGLAHANTQGLEQC